jgi:AbrB family looped-hinge helix DNA binding protein
MEVVTISSKYQVMIPRKVRKQFNLQPGQKNMFIPYNGTLRVVVVPLSRRRAECSKASVKRQMRSDNGHR